MMMVIMMQDEEEEEEEEEEAGDADDAGNATDAAHAGGEDVVHDVTGCHAGHVGHFAYNSSMAVLFCLLLLREAVGSIVGAIILVLIFMAYARERHCYDGMSGIATAAKICLYG